jgi:ADP-ribose pyrophosphatase YjhB (NUDIX family)
MTSADPPVLVWLLLEQDGSVLLTRRKAGTGAFPGVWSLPGDAVHESESASETIGRVAHEFLDITVHNETFVDTLYARDAALEYAVNVFSVDYTGRPRFRESGPFEQAGWVPPTDLPTPAVDGLSALLQRHATSGGEGSDT